MTKEYVGHQGDIFFKKMPDDFKLPEGAEEMGRDERGRLIVAEGEVTGHHHAVRSGNARLYTAGALMYLVATKAWQMEHEEHAVTKPKDADLMPPGTYLMKTQRENAYGVGVQRVAD